MTLFSKMALPLALCAGSVAGNVTHTELLRRRLQYIVGGNWSNVDDYGLLNGSAVVNNINGSAVVSNGPDVVQTATVFNDAGSAIVPPGTAFNDAGSAIVHPGTAFNDAGSAIVSGQSILPPAAVAENLAGPSREHLTAFLKNDMSRFDAYKQMPPGVQKELSQCTTVSEVEAKFNDFAFHHQIGTINSDGEWVDMPVAPDATVNYVNGSAIVGNGSDVVNNINGSAVVQTPATTTGGFGDARGRFVDDNEANAEFADLLGWRPSAAHDGVRTPPPREDVPVEAPPASPSFVAQPIEYPEVGSFTNMGPVANADIPDFDMSELSNLGLTPKFIETLDLPDGLLSAMNQNNIVDIMQGLPDYSAGSEMANTFNEAMNSITEALGNLNDAAAAGWEAIGDVFTNGMP